MPRKKGKGKLRPKTPRRIKQRRAGRERSLHHPELWGLVLVALGLFLGSVVYAGWNGGYVGGALADGLDVTHKALFTRTHADRLRDTGRAGRAVAELSDFFQRFHENRYGFDGSPIHDALAVADVIDPSLVTTVECNVEIETASQFCDGRTVVDRWHVTDRPRNARVGVDVEAERFLELLVERISSLP